MTASRLLVTIAALGALASCGDKAETGKERTTAAGEVLGGTVSDAMLPLDTVRSQSPPLRGGDAGEEEGGEDGGPGENQPAARPAPSTPAADPEPAPSPAATPEDEAD